MCTEELTEELRERIVLYLDQLSEDRLRLVLLFLTKIT